MLNFTKLCTAAHVAVVVLLGPAMAQNSEGHTYVIEGPGKTECAQFSSYEGSDNRVRDVASWLSGYLTAHHRLSADIFDLSPWQTPGVLVGLLRQYCDANPDSYVEEGAQDLVEYLTPRALRAPSEVVAMRKAEELVLLYEAVLRQVRTALSQAGFAPGTSEVGLAEALEAYQSSESLPVTGLPDQATLARLLR